MRSFFFLLSFFFFLPCCRSCLNGTHCLWLIDSWVFDVYIVIADAVIIEDYARSGSTLFYILFFVTLENPTRSFPFLPSFLPSWNWTPFYHIVFLGRTLDSEIADEMRLWRECTIILTGTRVTRIIRNHTSLLSQLVFTFKYMAIYQWSECWISVCSCIRMLTCMEARMSFITFSLYLSATLAKIYTIVCTHTSARTHAPPLPHIHI